MAKYYVQSGPIRLIFAAQSARQAAVKAFQWSCDRQATIESDCPLEHIHIAERNGWQLDELMVVNEWGFDDLQGQVFDTLEIVAAWESPLPPGLSRWGDNWSATTNATTGFIPVGR